MTGLPNAGRITSSLNTAKNDTGRIAFCGPYVVSALTGHTISQIEEQIRRDRGQPQENEKKIEGTTSDELASVLAVFGYEMTQKADYMAFPRKERPTVWQWMQKPRNAWIHYILAIQKGKEGHWILIKGVKMCDTYTEGRWTFVCDGPHRGARIAEIFEVRKALAGHSVSDV